MIVKVSENLNSMQKQLSNRQLSRYVLSKEIECLGKQNTEMNKKNRKQTEYNKQMKTNNKQSQ